jgi:hypothetical protein
MQAPFPRTMYLTLAEIERNMPCLPVGLFAILQDGALTISTDMH